ncbi:MAG: homocysteine S-methyltransferase family protein [Hyphomicrobiales bacterium]|nr:homocysteine S-methyltransferase family protein [Hyphomicrobiales bacterium]
MARKRASGRTKAKTGSGSDSGSRLRSKSKTSTKTTAVKGRPTAARSAKARTTRASVKKPPSSRGAAKARKGLLERLSEGPVICAEGYLFEFERRGYLQAGAFVPEVVLEHPELVESLHRDFVHAGSDVVEAFTYYAHREKLRIVGREKDLERINRQALRIAKKVAKETGALLAGNICNTNIYDPGDPQSHKAAQRMFDEQIGWAVENGVDFIIGETFSYTAEAELAAKSIKKSGLPAVVTLAVHKEPVSRENLPLGEAAKRLEAAGADVVGFNCIRGPWTMLPLLADVRAAVKCHVAALPVPYRTTQEEPTFQSLNDAHWHDFPEGRPFPTSLDPFVCNRHEIGEFAKKAYAIGVHYLGVCCGAGPHHIRAMAEALGRQPPASRYSPDMTKHAFFGSNKRLKAHNIAYAGRL